MSSHTPVSRRAQHRPKRSLIFNEQLVTWLYQVHHDPDFAPSALAVLLEIAWYMTSIGQCAWPSLDTIAENCGLSKSTVGELIKKLTACGHLIAEGGIIGGRGHSKRYRVNIIAVAPLTSLKGFAADVLDRDPVALNGTLAGPLAPEAGSIKGTLAGQNKERKKVSKKENKKAALKAAASIDRVPESLREVTPVTDAPPSPANTTARDTSLSIPEISNTESAPDGASIDRQSKIEKPESVASLELASRGSFAPDGGAPQPKEITMDEVAKKARAARITAIIIANRQRRRYFEMLLWHYPRRDCAHMAEAALARVLDEADDPGQLRCCLFDGAMAYVADMRAKNSFQFMSLAAFIEDGRWRPEFLPGNMAMAA